MRAGASNVPFVLDASVTLCWLFQDESDRTADVAAQLLLGSERAIVPLIWWFEVRNVIVVGMRRQRVTAERVRAFLAQSETAPIDIDNEVPAEEAVFQSAYNHRLSFYDACYLELAIRNGVPLATLDKSLARAAMAAGVPLIGV
jgi:predicted nucleic acid-binding protein